MTFSEEAQERHCTEFIRECRQKAWGAACHSDWISKGLDQIVARYEKLQAEDRDLEEKIADEAAPDYHTVDNRNKRKAMQERRNALANEAQSVAKDMQQGQAMMQQLINSTEASLALAKNAER